VEEDLNRETKESEEFDFDAALLGRLGPGEVSPGDDWKSEMWESRGLRADVALGL
jgi:hypothetical protein